MKTKRLPIRDPRTVARDIPGILDVVFPRLPGGLVASLNKKMFSFDGIKAVDEGRIGRTRLKRSMLFEIAVSHAELVLSGEQGDLTSAVEAAERRQKSHYDAKPVEELLEIEVDVIHAVSTNLRSMLEAFANEFGADKIVIRPKIIGFGWIGSGIGDFAVQDTLIEVKNTDRNFIAGDYRQIIMYWLLNYANVLERGGDHWQHYLLLNPRRNLASFGSYDELLGAASGGATRAEIIEQFRFAILEGANGFQ